MEVVHVRCAGLDISKKDATVCVRMHLDLIDQHTQALERLEDRIEEAMKPFTAARELLCSIPGWSTKVAEVFIAETGADMSMFPTAAELVSWAGLSPGANESAAKIKSTKIRPGNKHLKAAVGTAALAAARSTNTTFFSARFRRITARRGPNPLAGDRPPDRPPTAVPTNHGRYRFS